MKTLDKKLADGSGVIGTFCHLADAVAAECLSLSGLDYIIIDMEHSPVGYERAGEMIRAVQLYEAEPFVRTADSSRAALLHALDLGAKGLIIPDVRSVDEARHLVEFAKYFPLGSRGFAFSRSAEYGYSPELKNLGKYFADVNQKTLLMPQCETAGALENIREIAALDGIDGIFIGPYDLSVALGEPASFATSRFQEALEQVLAACREYNKLAFIYANTMAEARTRFSQGYQGVAIGTDTAFLVGAIREMLKS